MVHVKTEHPDVTVESYFETYIDPTPHVCPCCGRKCKFGQFKFNKTCGSAECLFKYKSEHNAMNNPVYRQRAIDGNVNRTPSKNENPLFDESKHVCVNMDINITGRLLNYGRKDSMLHVFYAMVIRIIITCRKCKRLI